MAAGHEWELSYGIGRPSQCSSCDSKNIHRAMEDRGPIGTGGDVLLRPISKEGDRERNKNCGAFRRLQFPLRAFWKKCVFMVLQTDNGKIAGLKILKKQSIRCMLWVSVMTVSMVTDITQHSSTVVHALNDCAMILCRGIGWRAADDISRATFGRILNGGAL